MYYIKETKQYGRGLYAVHPIKQNYVIETCELLVLTGIDTIQVSKTVLQFYTFKFNERQDCLVLGNGELFNHSNGPNVGYRLIGRHDRRVMQFYALRNIETDEQLFIDYEADTKINSSDYVNYNLY